jgi:hypothetical protein
VGCEFTSSGAKNLTKSKLAEERNPQKTQIAVNIFFSPGKHVQLEA